MRNFRKIFGSIAESYNRKSTINYIDLRDLETKIKGTDLINSLIDGFNKSIPVSLENVKRLQELVEDTEELNKTFKEERKRSPEKKDYENLSKIEKENKIEEIVMAEGLTKDEKQTILFNETGSFFAFSNKQLDEKKKEDVVYTNLGSGLICPKGKGGFVFKMLEKIEKQEITKRVEKGSLEGIISHAFYNYETGYTYDETDARDALVDYIEYFPKLFTEELISAVFQKCYRTSH